MTSETSAAWPEERRLAREGPDRTLTYFTQIREEVLDALAHPWVSEEANKAIVNWLRNQRDAETRLPDRHNLGEALVLALEQAGLPADASNLMDSSSDEEVYDDVAPAVAASVARAAILLLRGEPDQQSWKVVSNLRQCGNRLAPALDELLEQALAESSFRNRFFQLAESLVSTAAAAPERQVLAGEQEALTTLIQDWRDKRVLLDLWFGLRELDYVHYFGSEGEVLRQVARLDPSRFVSILGHFDNPYQVWAAINDTRAATRFEEWRALVDAAPIAFGSDGSWNGSAILPLLLVVAGQAVAQGAAPFARYETATAAQEGGREVTEAAEAVAAALFARVDGPPAALRWAAWLARSIASASAEGPPVPTDARDRAFTSWQLLSAVAQHAGPKTWASSEPPNLPAEEVWFSLMAKVVAVEQSPASAPDYANLLSAFMAPWPEDDPEAWQGKPGARLRAESGVVRTFARQPTTLGIRILALPLTMSEDPVAALIELWRRASVLREAVEFGELRLSASSEDDDPRRAAAELCWLTVDLGLCVIDQIADDRIAVAYEQGAAVSRLIALLWESVSEMIAIDRFGGETWDRARRHLVLRRALFAIDGDEGLGPRVISAESLPTLAGMLRTMAAPERPFFSSLVALLDAGLTVATLRSVLAESAIDLAALLDAAERANSIDERRPMIAANDLQRLRQAA
ncbi:hypothetical protein C8J36_110131 [Rhizobium sp. PP-F2F-G48]|uniref:hypothetical protein n=1 Tax=Rhizobium sp. PP-F2F-G48 TaxID=2135651 RepID=UPI0010ECA85D|nr:hypothetical protein [Rhizobium sp. PP-F2F-G48]TCM51124.1 hypothetical protein C8J36_110131 [Rhizobium sp. PP-F2F-G48]